MKGVDSTQMITPTLRDLNSRHRDLYDVLAGEYEARVPALASITELALTWSAAHLPSGASVLDVGCGPGAALAVLCRLGFHVTGIDISPEMTARAARRAPQATVITGDVLTHPFARPFLGINAFAFIHLFPAAEVPRVLRRLHDLLVPWEGRMLISTTREVVSAEGLEPKADYPGLPLRFRKHWRPEELELALRRARFEILDERDHADPLGKLWMDYIVRAPRLLGRGLGLGRADDAPRPRPLLLPRPNP